MKRESHFFCIFLKSLSLYRLRRLLFFAAFFTLPFSIHSNSYQLEYAVTGIPIKSIVSDDYKFEVSWGEVTSGMNSEPYVYQSNASGFLDILLGMMSGDSTVLLSQGAEVVAGWKKAGWFGFFFGEHYPWVYHQHFNWIFIEEKPSKGLWFYHSTMHWAWTNHKVYPYIFLQSEQKWIYAGLEQNPGRIFDFQKKSWVDF